ncbi:phosphatidate cytidylyltransferase [Vulgatibacter sp.]|uniref:phosphatidate cytidylyltransferase n=1 Tax=Vulgatibacter sp. TaxID=1971226 RepID=UPI0035699E6E
MNDKNRNLFLRIASAVVLLPLVLWLLWLGGVATIALVAIASAIVASEILGIAGLRLGHPAALVSMAAAASFAWFAGDLQSRWPGALGVVALAPLLTLALLTLLPPERDLKKAAPLAAFAAMAPTYAGLCLAAIVAMRSFPGTAALAWILVALVVTWGNDTGAYFAGRFLGRHKLYPMVSPAKTWEGFAGGMAASILGCFAIRWLLWPAFTPVDCLVLGGVAGLLGPVGDLSESMLKRAHGVKDSGKIMPGHGGLYDRVDALLFNAPWVYAYAFMVHGLV